MRHRIGVARRLRAGLGDFVKALLLLLPLLPLLCWRQSQLSRGRLPRGWHRRSEDPKDFMGLAVALHSCPPERLAEEIRRLGVRRILLRIPVWEVDRLDVYRAFMDRLPEADFVVCAMQDRERAQSLERWRESLGAIVEACWPRVRTFQVGQGANRSKWGFLSASQYLAFASEAEALRGDYPGIELVGPNALDFETLPLLRCLFHRYPVRWDAVGCALYVDRRGSPRNKQLGFFDFRRKLLHFASLVAYSPKASRRLWITEVNWPIENQGPYSPVSEDECYGEEEIAEYLREYYEDAWWAQCVERVYWWQLVAKGFGLMDVEKDGSLRPRPAYDAFAKLLREGFPAEPPQPRDRPE